MLLHPHEFFDCSGRMGIVFGSAGNSCRKNCTAHQFAGE